MYQQSQSSESCTGLFMWDRMESLRTQSSSPRWKHEGREAPNLPVSVASTALQACAAFSFSSFDFGAIPSDAQGFPWPCTWEYLLEVLRRLYRMQGIEPKLVKTSKCSGPMWLSLNALVVLV